MSVNPVWLPSKPPAIIAKHLYDLSYLENQDPVLDLYAERC